MCLGVVYVALHSFPGRGVVRAGLTSGPCGVLLAGGSLRLPGWTPGGWWGGVQAVLTQQLCQDDGP